MKLIIFILILLPSYLSAAIPHWPSDGTTPNQCNSFSTIVSDQNASCQAVLDTVNDNDQTGDMLELVGIIDNATCDVLLNRSNGFSFPTSRSVFFCGFLCPNTNNSSTPLFDSQGNCPTTCPNGTFINPANNGQCDPIPESQCQDRAGTTGFFEPPSIEAAGNCLDGCTVSTVCVETPNFVGCTGEFTGSTCSPSESQPSSPTENYPVPSPNTQPLDEVPDNGCISSPSGGVLCSPDAPVPPTPDSGTPSDPASPDATYTNTETNQTNNYYNETTTNNSSTNNGAGTGQGPDGSGQGDSSNDPVDGIGTQDNDGDGEPDGCDPSLDPSCDDSFGNTNCSAPPECSGDPIQCGQSLLLWEQKCYVEASQEYLSRDNLHNQSISSNQDIPEEQFDVADALNYDTSGLSSVGSGSCPQALSVNVLDTTIEFSFDAFCQLASYLSPLVIGFALFIAGRISLGGL